MRALHRVHSLAIAFLVLSAVAIAQPAQKLIRAAGTDDGWIVVSTPDGGCLLGGQTTSFGAGLADAFLMKFGPLWTVEWARVFGGPGSDWINRLVLSPDSTVVLAGYTTVPGNDWDGWLFKVNLSGTLLWSKRYGGAGTDLLADVILHPAGGYVVAGHATSYGNGNDIWVLRLNDSGNVVQARTYGGYSTEAANHLIPTSDGGYLVAGHTYTFGAGLHDIALFKLSASLDLQWMKTYGTGLDETAYVVDDRPSGGYLIVGGTHAGAYGGRDVVLMRVDTAGALLSASSIGTVGEDQLVRGFDLGAEGLAISGWAADSLGILDGWFATVADNGTLSRSIRIGGPAFDRLLGLGRTPSGQLMIAGSSESGEAQGTDAYLVRMPIGGPPLPGSLAGPATLTPMSLISNAQSPAVGTPTVMAQSGPDSTSPAVFTVTDLFNVPEPATPHVFIPPVFSRAGDAVAIPVMVSSPFGVAGGDFALTVDTAIVEVRGVRRGTLTAPFTLAFNVSRPESVLVSLASNAGVSTTSTGSLFVLDGMIRPGVPDSITSQIHFRRADLYDALAHSVERTVEDGQLWTGFGRKGDVNSDQQVNAADAILALRIVAGLEQRNERDHWAADFDGNGMVTPFDAVGILRAAVGLTTPAPGDTLLPPVRIFVSPMSASAGQTIEMPVRIEGLPNMVSGSLEFGFREDLVQVRGPKPRVEFEGLVEMGMPAAARAKLVFAAADAWGQITAEVAAIELKALRSMSAYVPSLLSGSLTDKDGRSVNTFQFVTTDVDDGGAIRSFALHPNHPNPFNPSTTIRFDVSHHSRVQIVVRNLLGQEVAVLVDDERPAGTYQTQWRALAGSGVYFCTMTATDNVTGRQLATFTQKLLLLR